MSNAALRLDALSAHSINFAHLVGPGWYRLPAATRARFAEHPEPGGAIRFAGVMHAVRSSWLGLALAHASRLVGTPFAPWRGENVPMEIVLRDGGSDAITWERVYHYPGRAPVHVYSTKRLGADGALHECVGFGLGMRLAVFEADRALHFLSLRYFWRIGARFLWLPRWLTPGTTHVVHTDLGGGRFRFTMNIHHALFGTLFHQDGVFHRV